MGTRQPPAFYLFLCKYISLVARPPLMWRSALLLSNTSFTSAASPGLISWSRSVISLCTVDLETLNLAAVLLTVAPVSTM